MTNPLLSLAELEALPDGTLYDCRESETLSIDDVAEAVHEWLSHIIDSHEGPVADLIAQYAPATLTAYRTMAVPEHSYEQWAENALEDVRERFLDEYGGPDASTDDSGLDDAALRAGMPAMVEAVRAFLKNARVWNCEPIGHAELDAMTIEKMMREHDSAMFDDDEDGPPVERADDVDGDALFASLKTLRNHFAVELGLPAYMVFTNSTLLEMAARRPTTPPELLTVAGVGPKKLAQFGDAFLALLRDTVSPEGGADG